MGLFGKASFDNVIVGIDALCINHREIKVPNDIEALHLTLINNPAGSGVIVSQLGAEGSAASAGMVVGDVIRYVNGQGIDSHEHAFALMREDDGREELCFTLSGTPRTISIDKSMQGKLLITVADRDDQSGVQVTEVGEDGLASMAGIECGDVILSINGTRVTKHQKAIELLDSEPRFLEVVIADASSTPSSPAASSRRSSGTPALPSGGLEQLAPYRVAS